MSLPSESYSSTEIRESLRVGKYSSIAPNVVFCEINDNHLCAVNKRCVYTTNWSQPPGNGDIEIGSDVWIGRNVLILPGVKIGNGVIVGAGAVVTKDVPDYAVLVGNPGRVKRYRFEKNQIKRLLQIKWWDWDYDKVVRAKEDMLDIEGFLEKYG